MALSGAWFSHALRAAAPLSLLLGLEAPYIIPPGREGLVASMLGGDPLPGGCRLTSASIEQSLIRASYQCRPPNGSLVVTLRHPYDSTDAAVVARTTQFAVESSAAARVIPGLLPALVARIQAHETAWQWLAQESQPAEPAAERSTRRAGSQWRPPLGQQPGSALVGVVLAFALVAALGALAARALRRLTAERPRVRRVAAVALGTLVLAIACALDVRWFVVGVWDVIVAASTFVAVLWARALPREVEPLRLSRVMLSTTIVLGGVGGMELWIRAHPVERPFAARTSQPRLLVTSRDRDFRCAAIYRAADVAFLRYRGAPDLPEPRPGHRRVMHVGDSMIESFEVSDRQHLTALLERARPADEHLNLGLSAIGTDAELLIVRRWVGGLRPTQIVLHVFPGNDIADLDAPYACCDGGALLGTGPDLTPRCPSPSWRTTFGEALRQSPPPYPVRLLARWSALCALASYRFQVATAVRSAPFDATERLQRFGAILTAIGREASAHHVPLAVSVLPVRAGYGSAHPIDRDRVVAAARATGLTTLDAGPVFEAAARQNPRGRWFQPNTGNPHFDVDGERLYADWLASTLWPQ